MPQIIGTVLATPRPLLLHAAGGFGKTVIMQAIAQHFEAQGDLVLLFDGFGAGEWRNLSDARHLPHKALPYLANLLAAKGLEILIASSLVEDVLFSISISPSRDKRQGYSPGSKTTISVIEQPISLLRAGHITATQIEMLDKCGQPTSWSSLLLPPKQNHD